MRVGIVGLGLIGGSLAKAYSRAGGHEVLACELDAKVLAIAQVEGAVQGELTADNMSGCDLILIAISPAAAIRWLREAAPMLREGQLVIDCCGTKRDICKAGFDLAERYGFTFAGGHPMAGTHNSGFAYSRADMFEEAPMVVVPRHYDDMALLERIRRALEPAGFGRMGVTTAEEHDRLIAFTSQMPHVVSNAFIKSPTARGHRGVSAGSYRDLTRVAWLNPEMWADLFIQNADHLIEEIDIFIGELTKYKEAITAGDMEGLRSLLDEGRRLKAQIDGEGL